MVFPAKGLPEVAARAPAAAMAEAELYYIDPTLPKQPKKAYTHLISNVPVPGAFAGVSSQQAISAESWRAPDSPSRRIRHSSSHRWPDVA